MPPREEIMRSLVDPATTTLDAVEAAVLLGISKSHCYHTIIEEGTLGGLPVIRVGSRIKIPAEPMRKLLGITANNTQSEHHDEIEVDGGKQSI
jgi:excisionase family DNA binding protein